MTKKSFIRTVRESRQQLKELLDAAREEDSVFKYRIESAFDNIKAIEDTYYEILRIESGDDEPYIPNLREVK